MTPMTFDEWRAADEQGANLAPSYERYRAYLAGVAFIRSQIGGLPLGVAGMARVELEPATGFGR